jgi:hypothetical protein
MRNQPARPFLAEFVNSLITVRQVLAATFESSDDTRAGNMLRRRPFIEQLRKRDDVRRIGPDDAQPQIGSQCQGRVNSRAQGRQCETLR